MLNWDKVRSERKLALDISDEEIEQRTKRSFRGDCSHWNF